MPAQTPAELANEALINQADRAAEQAAEAFKTGANTSFSQPPPGSETAESALDAAFAEVQKEPGPEAATEANLGYENGGVEKIIEGAPKKTAAEPAKEPVEEPAKEPAVEPEKPAEPAASEGKKDLLDELLKDSTAKPEPEKPAEQKDPYADVKLRPDASPKTKETFAEIKRIAHEREAAARKEAEDLKIQKAEADKQIEEFQKKLADVKQISPEVEQELKELRSFRAQFDVEHDPEFKSKYDSRLEKNYESIYGHLKQHGLPDAEVVKLKSFTKDDRDVAIESFLEKLPTSTRRAIEAKLVDNAGVADERRQALEEARQKADELLAQRREEPARLQQQRDSEIAENIKPVLKVLPWLHNREVPSTATAQEKAAIEAHNKFAEDMQERLRTAIVDESPKTRAQAALAVPIAMYLRRELDATRAQLEASQKELDNIRKASTTSRTARTTAAPIATAPKPKVYETSEDALDALLKEVQAAGPR